MNEFFIKNEKRVFTRWAVSTAKNNFKRATRKYIRGKIFCGMYNGLERKKFVETLTKNTPLHARFGLTVSRLVSHLPSLFHSERLQQWLCTLVAW